MNKAPLVLEMNGWTGLDVDVPIEELCKFGPTVAIDIWPSDKPANQSNKLRGVLAQIDTGSSHSCISPRLIPKLDIKPTGILNTYDAGLEPKDVPIFRCTARFPYGTEMEADFAVLSQLAKPHDALIGRNILDRCRLIVDFTSGNFQIHFKHPK